MRYLASGELVLRSMPSMMTYFWVSLGCFACLRIVTSVPLSSVFPLIWRRGRFYAILPTRFRRNAELSKFLICFFGACQQKKLPSFAAGRFQRINYHPIVSYIETVVKYYRILCILQSSYFRAGETGLMACNTVSLELWRWGYIIKEKGLTYLLSVNPCGGPF